MINRKKFVFANIVLGIIVSVAIALTGCTRQTMTKEFGGTTEIDLDAGLKLEEITWKDKDNLWILTRPMREDEQAEEHCFKESSAFGIVEGKVIIREHELEE